MTWMAKEQEEEPVTLGPRGGTTTVTRSGMVKKNLWVPLDEAELLRQKAFEERRSEADIIREGLGLMLYPWRRRRRPGKKGGATGGPSG